MPTIYAGNPANVTTPLVRTVTNATNATPIEITVSGAHLFGDDDFVTIDGVVGNTAANGGWTITVTSSTKFTLSSSVGNGAYVSGGTATDHSMTPQIVMPSDGDPATANSVNSPMQALADRTQYAILQTRTLMTQTFTTFGAWVAPPRVTEVLIRGIGGGGGGGGGAGIISAIVGGGGGGGGGAIASNISVPVTPGVSYAIIIGSGGTGGAGTATGSNNGSDGTASSFSGLAHFNGGAAGGGGGDRSTGQYAIGGGPVSGNGFYQSSTDLLNILPGMGGNSYSGITGANASSQTAGRINISGPTGPSVGGTPHFGTIIAATGGGGGGNSSWEGGIGGTGGNGWPSGSVGANGALGGGGGGGGADPTLSFAGGNGGGGVITLVWWQ